MRKTFRNTVRGLFPLAILAISSLRPAAAEPSKEILGADIAPIESLVADVLQHNPELNFYQAEIGALKGEHLKASTVANPELSATAGTKNVRGIGPGSSSGDGLAWSVSVRQTFEWPGRIPLRKAIANEQLELARLGFSQFKIALASRSRSLAYGLMAAQEKSKAAREVADRFKALREVLIQRDPAGLTPLLELRIIEATELTIQRKATEADLDEQSAALELNQLRGEAWEHRVIVQPAQLTFSPAPPTETLLSSAAKTNFELKMRDVELKQQGLKVSLAQNERYPAVSVGPYFSKARGSDNEEQVGVGVSLPMPLWDRNTGKIAAEEAREEQATISLSLARRNIERQVIEKALIYQRKLLEMDRWKPESIAEFRKAAELADRHYRLGAVPIATYIELQKQYLEAIEALLSTKTEALDAAQELEKLTGLNFKGVQIDGLREIEK